MLPAEKPDSQTTAFIEAMKTSGRIEIGATNVIFTAENGESLDDFRSKLNLAFGNNSQFIQPTETGASCPRNAIPHGLKTLIQGKPSINSVNLT